MEPHLQRLGEALAERYRFERELGQGGMASVVLAHDLKHGRQVAIKVLRPELWSARGGERFLREIGVAARLTHPHILPLHDSGSEAGVLFYVMPYVEGETLGDRMAREQQLPFDEVVRLTTELAGALDFAHQRGVVHRDIKPDNILLQAGHVVIADFGVARALDAAGEEEDKLTASGLYIGTPMYSSPEQAAARTDIDGRSDQYSLGCLVYEMLAGHPPFNGTSAQELMVRHLTDPVPSLRAARPGVPAAMEAAIARTMAKSPADRFATAGDFARALIAPAPARPAIRARVLAGAGAAAGVILVALAVKAQRPRAAERAVAPPSVAPLFTGEARESRPSWSPAGNLFAYASDEAGNLDIWIADAGGSNRINLTAGHEGIDDFPVWSPDGSRLAFYSERDGAGIYTMSALGGEVRKVITVRAGTYYTFSLQWAANGSLVYTDFDSTGTKHVWRLASDSSHPQCLSCNRASSVWSNSNQGALSPSGTLLAFQSLGRGFSGPVHVADLRTSRSTQITSNGGFAQWHGDTLLFLSERDGVPDLWGVTVSESGTPLGEPRRLTSGLNATLFAVRADGAILAVRTGRSSNLWSFPLHRRQVELADGTRLTETEGFVDARPRFDRQTGAIVFESNRRGSYDIWRLATASGAVSRLTSSLISEQRPRPSPDGRWIAYDVIDDTMIALHLMRSDGSDARPAIPGATRTGTAEWSPDGRRLAMMYAAADTFMIGIGVLNAATGTIGDLIVRDVPGGSEEYPRWSRDGRHLAYESFVGNSWDLWVVDSQLDHPRRLLASPGNERFAAWSHDGRALFFTMLHGSGGSLWRVELDGDARTLGAPMQWLHLPAGYSVGIDGVDLDDTRLVAAIVREASDIWLVEWPKR